MSTTLRTSEQVLAQVVGLLNKTVDKGGDGTGGGKAKVPDGWKKVDGSAAGFTARGSAGSATSGASSSTPEIFSNAAAAEE